jgi:hypothetical protein
MTPNLCYLVKIKLTRTVKGLNNNKKKSRDSYVKDGVAENASQYPPPSLGNLFAL